MNFGQYHDVDYLSRKYFFIGQCLNYCLTFCWVCGWIVFGKYIQCFALQFIDDADVMSEFC